MHTVNWAKNVSERELIARGIDNYQINSFQDEFIAQRNSGSALWCSRGTGYQYLNGRRVINCSRVFLLP